MPAPGMRSAPLPLCKRLRIRCIQAPGRVALQSPSCHFNRAYTTPSRAPKYNTGPSVCLSRRHQHRALSASSSTSATDCASDKDGTAQDLDFGDARVAFESKSTFELLRTWAVFQTCKIGFIVRNCDSLYSASLKVFGASLTHGILRHSFFNHFCAGENALEIIPCMNELKKYGIGGILDYAAEAKEDSLPKVVHAADEAGTVGAPQSSRHYDYRGEAVCDANTEIFLDAIRAVHDATPDGFAAIKLSGLGNPVLLERVSTCLVEIVRLFKRVRDGDAASDLTQPYHCIDRSFTLDFETFSAGWQKLFTGKSEEELRLAFKALDKDDDGLITYMDWSTSLKLSEINNLVRGCIAQGPLYRASLDEEELELYTNMCTRVERILDLAKTLEVRVMVDAEWIDIQPAIDHMVLSLQRKYNLDGRHTVFNTYQTYLKGMQGRVVRDLERSRREGWCFGAKVVRGAYMVSEREKARQRGMESPICESYEDTEANFHGAIDAILTHKVGKSGSSSGTANAEVLVASHNRGSIEYTLRRIEELQTDRSCVYFGQLLGMADHLTFTLGTNGYKAYKYVPYGPIAEVVPYLIRRTQENSAILGSPGVQEERQMVVQELRRRLSPI
mmetsp:Transcript_44069/g.125709  ORF Transcript_44069/g.125709 Transcript_44069/m.125709 type:complete len:616 (+) Transcript_44069:35-1882(+)